MHSSKFRQLRVQVSEGAEIMIYGSSLYWCYDIGITWIRCQAESSGTLMSRSSQAANTKIRDISRNKEKIKSVLLFVPVVICGKLLQLQYK